MQAYISYIRPTKRADQAAQEAAVRQFVELNKASNPGKVVASFIEADGMEGKAEGWPALQQAIAATLQRDGVLVIAHVGRVARNTVFTLSLQRSGVKFVCCDVPNANHLTVHVLVNLAERESQAARQRSLNSLAAAKARGVKLGSHREGHWKGREHRRGWQQAVAGSIKKRKERAAAAYQFLIPEIKARRERGDTMAEIAQWLNDTGHMTTVGKPFTDVAVWRIVRRYLGGELLGNNARKFADAGT